MTLQGEPFMKLLRHMVYRYFYRRSIQYQLLTTYIIINIVPIIIIGIISYKVSSTIIIEDSKNMNVKSNEEISRAMNSYMKGFTDQLNVFRSKILNNDIRINGKVQLNDVKLLENIMEINDYLTATFDSTHDYLSIRVFSDNGAFISSAFNRETYKVLSYNSHEDIRWRQRLQDNVTEQMIYDIHPLDINGDYSFVVGGSIINPYTKARKGYISYEASFSSIKKIFENFESIAGSELRVIRKDGTLLYDSDYKLIGQKADASLLNLVQKSEETNLTGEIDQKQMLITYAKLADYDLTVVGTVPIDLLTERIIPLRNVIILISLISLVLVSMLSLFFSFYITNPIKKLSGLMNKVGRGNFDVSINLSDSDSNIEIRNLSKNFNSMVDTIKQMIKYQYETELYRKDAELKALLMQINPHFLYNTLEVISGIADYEGVDQISEITQALSKMLRYNIDLKADKVRIADEITNCQNYFLILKSRFEDHLIVEMDIDQNATPYMIIKMVLQPLLENCIKHGIEKKIGKGHIGLFVRKIDQTIEIQIKDNGVGFDPEKLKEFEVFKALSSNVLYDLSAIKSLGLKNVYSRLRIVFGERLDFQIYSVKDEGASIQIRIPAFERGD
jgi:two-component system sensor histidine kinase YesM